MLQLGVYQVMDALGKLGEYSRSKRSPVPLKRFSRALSTFRLHNSLCSFTKRSETKRNISLSETFLLILRVNEIFR